MKLLIILIMFMAIGCSGHPVPAESVKICMDKNKVPIYFSNGCTTSFACVDKDQYKAMR